MNKTCKCESCREGGGGHAQEEVRTAIKAGAVEGAKDWWKKYKEMTAQESEGGWESSIYIQAIEVLLERMSPETIKEVKSFIGQIVQSRTREIYELVDGMKIEETHTNLAHSDYNLRSYNASLSSLLQQLKDKYLN